MDFMPDIEFHKVFNRISKRINLKGCNTPEEINVRLKKKIYEIKVTHATPIGALQVGGKIISLRTLIYRGFARRAIDDAGAYPRGKIALTLRFGRNKALEIIEKRKHKRAWI